MLMVKYSTAWYRLDRQYSLLEIIWNEEVKLGLVTELRNKINAKSKKMLLVRDWSTKYRLRHEDVALQKHCPGIPQELRNKLDTKK